MKIPARPRQHGLAINITPLIDVVFLLIIFFLVASHFVRSEPQEPVDLPRSAITNDDEARPPKRIIVTIMADSSLFVSGKQLSLQEAEQMIFSAAKSNDTSGMEVRIRGDREVPYKTIEPLLLVCARNGIQNVGFAVTVAGSP